jgi:hypothetical protein
MPSIDGRRARGGRTLIREKRNRMGVYNKREYKLHCGLFQQRSIEHGKTEGEACRSSAWQSCFGYPFRTVPARDQNRLYNYTRAERKRLEKPSMNV